MIATKSTLLIAATALLTLVSAESPTYRAALLARSLQRRTHGDEKTVTFAQTPLLSTGGNKPLVGAPRPALSGARANARTGQAKEMKKVDAVVKADMAALKKQADREYGRAKKGTPGQLLVPPHSGHLAPNSQGLELAAAEEAKRVEDARRGRGERHGHGKPEPKGVSGRKGVTYEREQLPPARRAWEGEWDMDLD